MAKLLSLIGIIGNNSVCNAILLGESLESTVLCESDELLVNLSGKIATLLEADSVELNVAGESVYDLEISVVTLTAVALCELCVNNCEVSISASDAASPVM